MEQNESLVKIGKKRNSLSVRAVVNMKAYHDAFVAMPVPKAVSQGIYEQAGRILQEADGTENEHMAAVNARTGKLVADNIGREPSRYRTGFNEDEMAAVNACLDGVIIIHNHPGSKAPSYRNLISASKTEAVRSSVVVGHDGSVWYMAINGSEIANYPESLYNESKDEFSDIAESKAVRWLLEENEIRHLFTWMRLR